MPLSPQCSCIPCMFLLQHTVHPGRGRKGSKASLGDNGGTSLSQIDAKAALIKQMFLIIL